MDVNPDFRSRLEESFTGANGHAFKSMPAGSYRISIQIPCGRRPRLPPDRALEDYDRWELAVYTDDGKPATPSTHPHMFQDGLWGQYWTDNSIAPSVPTEVVQTFFDFLVLGPERYQQMTSSR
ncbi:MAG: hypothetical protein WD942_04395 [Dehalococcoidia bacterium]